MLSLSPIDQFVTDDRPISKGYFDEEDTADVWERKLAELEAAVAAMQFPLYVLDATILNEPTS